MFAYDRKSSVPMTATRIRKTPRTRVRASPRPASTIPRQSRAISHPLPGCTETPKDDIAIVQGLVIGGDVPVDPVHPVLPVPAPFPVHRAVDGRDEDAFRDLERHMVERKPESGGGLGENSVRGVVHRRGRGIVDRPAGASHVRSEEHTSELQSPYDL